MNTFDLEALKELINNFVKEREWEQFHSMKNLSMALTKESAELMELYQWMKEEESNEAHKDPSFRQRLEEETADVFVYLMRMVSRAEIDLQKAVTEKMKKNAEKYPVEKSKGNAKKYTEL